MNDTELVDRGIVEIVLAAVDSGNYPNLHRWRAVFQELYNRLSNADISGATGATGLDSVLKQNQQLYAETVFATADEALRFVKSEVDRYKELGKVRPLTADEQRVGRDCLLPLLQALSSLIAGLKR